MARFSLHAVGPDRPGIVAALTQALADLGCNLEDSRMARLQEQFSIVLVLQAHGVTNGAVIEEALAPLLERLALQLLVRPLAEAASDGDLGELVAIEIDGADHPGMIARITRAIAAAGGNIVQLFGHVAPERPEVPSRLQITAELRHASVPGLRADLDAIAADLGIRSEVEELAPDQTALLWG